MIPYIQKEEVGHIFFSCHFSNCSRPTTLPHPPQVDFNCKPDNNIFCHKFSYFLLGMAAVAKMLTKIVKYNVNFNNFFGLVQVELWGMQVLA